MSRDVSCPRLGWGLILTSELHNRAAPVPRRLNTTNSSLFQQSFKALGATMQLVGINLLAHPGGCRAGQIPAFCRGTNDAAAPWVERAVALSYSLLSPPYAYGAGRMALWHSSICLPGKQPTGSLGRTRVRACAGLWKVSSTYARCVQPVLCGPSDQAIGGSSARVEADVRVII